MGVDDSRGQDEWVNTDDLLYLLATFGDPAPAEVCGTEAPSPPAQECRDEESQMVRDTLFCALRDRFDASVAEIQEACPGSDGQATLLDTCTENLDAATADLEAVEASFTATITQCVQTTAALQSALEAEHALTVAAMHTNCNATLESSLAIAEDECIAASSELQAALETEHATTLSVMEMDCNAEIAASAASHAEQVTALETQLAELQSEKQQELMALHEYYAQQLAQLHCPLLVPFADVTGDTNYGGAGVTISCHTGYLPAGKPALLRFLYGTTDTRWSVGRHVVVCVLHCRREPARVYASWDVESSPTNV